ncbi:MAG: hypothetical protein JNL98_08005 [Bryobacterales bacterium]|nr:hypothetical protein [Bryobacterales bacterium]
MRITFYIARATVCVLLATAAYWSLRLAWADHLFRSDQPGNIQRAAQLVPFHALYQARAGNLHRAVELNPYLSSAWLELAHNAEATADFREAERCLLRAAAVDHQFEPRWALANFYFRRSNPQQFWHWIRLAAERSYGDRSAIYRICWRMTEDPAKILANAIPRDPTLLADYLQFLTADNRLDAAMNALPLVLRHATPDQQNVFMALCERLLSAGRGPDAATVWNGVIGRGWLPYRTLDPGSSAWLTNAALEVSPLGKGFDWRLLWRAGVTSAWIPTMRQLRIELTGKQAEETEIVRQFVPSVPAGRYVFRYRYRTEGFPQRSGVRWQVRDLAQPIHTAVASGELFSPDWKTGELAFPVPQPAGLIEIVLLYRRSPGTSRAEGSVWFEHGFDLQTLRPEVARTSQ